MKNVRVRLLREVRSDMPEIFKPVKVATIGEYAGKMNKNGAVCIILSDKSLLGVKPGEFAVIDETPEDELTSMLENDSIGG